jgi:hypothetical protein
MTSLRWLCGIALLALVGGCGPSPQQEAHDGRERASSWAASVKAAVDAWAAGAVSESYVENTLDAANKDLTSQAKRLDSDVGPDAAAPLRAVTTRLPHVTDRVQHGDRDGARREAEALP